MIFIIQALRSKNVGWDTPVYYSAYSMLQRVPIFGYRWEPLYVLLNKIAYQISRNPQTLFILSSAIINISLGKFFLDNLEDGEAAFWTVFLYITLLPYFNSINLLRQYLAIAIAIHSYTILKNDQSVRAYIKALLLIAIGFCFHRTALILITIPIILSLKKVGLKEIGIVLIATALFLIFFNRLLNLFLRIFPVYRKYLETHFLEGLSASGYHYIVAAAKAAILIFYFINNKTEIRNNVLLGHEALFCLISIVVTLLRTRISFAVRLGYYFEIPAILFMSKAPLHTTEKSKRIIYMLLLLLGIVSFTYLVLSPNGSRGASEYRFFWQV